MQSISQRAAAAGLGLMMAFSIGCQGPQAMNVTHESFGSVDGQDVDLYTLTNDHGLVARITNYGGIVTELHTPDADGEMADIVLGFDTLDEYIASSPYFGAMVGRVGNRIALGRFGLDGVVYELATNNGPNHLHGGIKGFDKVVWDAKPRQTDDGPALELTYTSADGEEGYPGTVEARVVYTLTNADELRVEMWATTDKATPINLVHHSYWNLAGHQSGSILDHVLTIAADRYTPTDATLIPTGAIEPVEFTPFDFRMPKAIGRDIAQLPPAGDDPGGYDLNYVLNGWEGGEGGEGGGGGPALRLAGTVTEPRSGRVMTISTTEPGIQFYSGNFLDGLAGKGGAQYDQHDGFCLETQHFPDAVNKEGKRGWPSVILRPGQTYHHLMVHAFSTQPR
jgi:aldose 1-epimerase